LSPTTNAIAKQGSPNSEHTKGTHKGTGSKGRLMPVPFTPIGSFMPVPFKHFGKGNSSISLLPASGVFATPTEPAPVPIVEAQGRIFTMPDIGRLNSLDDFRQAIDQANSMVEVEILHTLMFDRIDPITGSFRFPTVSSNRTPLFVVETDDEEVPDWSNDSIETPLPTGRLPPQSSDDSGDPDLTQPPSKIRKCL
jgi:hypothetical protein